MLIPLDRDAFELQYTNYLRVSRTVGEATIRNYLSGARTFWDFANAENPSELQFTLTQRTLTKYVAWLTGKGLSNNSIARNISSLRSLVRYLQTQDKSTESFPIIMGKPRTQASAPLFLSEPQIKNLLEKPDACTFWGLRDACIIEILYSTGVRVSELTQIDVSSVDLDSQTIRVIGKGSKERVVFLNKRCHELVDRYLVQLHHSDTQRRGTNRPLFINRNSGRLTNRSIQRIIKGYAKTAGIDPSTHPHTLRHSFATHMLDGGASLTSVQKLLGHSSTRATQVYLHPNLEKARQIYREAHPRAKGHTDAKDERAHHENTSNTRSQSE